MKRSLTCLSVCGVSINMFHRCRRLIVTDIAALLLLFIVIVSQGNAQAAPDSIRFDLVEISACTSDVVEGRLVLSVRDQNGGVIDMSGSDLELRFSTAGAVSLFHVSASASTSLTFGVALPGLGTGYADVLVILASDPSVQSPILRINCANLTYEIISSDGEVVSSDGRLNLNAGDLINVLYAGTDAQGKPAIDVYTVDGERGVYFGEFEYTLFEPYLDTPPAANTRIATVNKSTLYALSSGEFQINIGPDAEGKYGVVIFRGLPPTSARRSILELR